MAIEIHCPNGHRLSCPDDRAGRTGKCPTCEAGFTIPGVNGQSEGENMEPADDEKASVSEGSIGSGSGKQNGGKGEQGLSEEQIVFLCPQGHKLNGPASLQGKPGKCPHCNSTFRIPVFGDVENPKPDATEKDESENDKELLMLNFADETEGVESEATDPMEEIAVVPRDEEDGGALPMIDTSVEETMYSEEGSYQDDEFDDEMNPLARLFLTLWQEREHGGVVEIHLEDRETLCPDWWARGLSLESYGVFAMQTPDGSYTIETVAWDAVKRITVKRITELPDGIFA